MRNFSWDSHEKLGPDSHEKSLWENSHENLMRNLMRFSWEISREILMRNWDTILMRIVMRNPYEKFLMRFSWELLWEISHKAPIWEISHDHSFHQKCLLPEQYNPLERSYTHEASDFHMINGGKLLLFFGVVYVLMLCLVCPQYDSTVGILFE